ncbi:lysophospholipid acyltransferase family protein [Streptomyces sp. NBC_01304]|uniref:lysophospholipid acyltransferase family protein n=1 Tax=Streptomyces sp. NBC_01304 TaxID=2903818 RepID=UPI002E13261E
MRRYRDFGLAVLGALASGGALADPEVVRGRALRLLDALDVRLEGDASPLRVAGPAGPGTLTPGTLIAADHISWLDVVALLAREPVTVVAKREVGGWPVVGRLARAAGTCFIDRDRLRDLPDAVGRVRDALAGGRSVVVFPQGTTWCRASGGVFRRAMFQAALDAGAAVRPVTVSYLQGGVASTVAAFVGDDGFVPSLRRVARARGLAVRVQGHAPLFPGDWGDRRVLAAAAQEAVFGADLIPHPAPSRKSSTTGASPLAPGSAFGLCPQTPDGLERCGPTEEEGKRTGSGREKEGKRKG